jgi:hypothetical protein
MIEDTEPNDYFYIIIYPDGDSSLLEVIPIIDVEISNYSSIVVSRKQFPYTEEGRQLAINYAKELATKHNKEYIGYIDEPKYLD